MLAWAVLERQGDEVAEAAPRHGVLVGEEAIVGGHGKLVPPGHGLGDEKATHLAGGARRHRSVEEEPDVCSVARPGALDREVDTLSPACFDEGAHVLPPLCLVEVHGEKPASLILQHRVDPDHVVSFEMIVDGLLGHRDERLVRTLATLDATFVAQAADPFIAACWRVALRALLGVDPALGIDVGPATEKPHEERDLLFRCRWHRPARHFSLLGRPTLLFGHLWRGEPGLQLRDAPRYSIAFLVECGQTSLRSGDLVLHGFGIAVCHDCQPMSFASRNLSTSVVFLACSACTRAIRAVNALASPCI